MKTEKDLLSSILKTTQMGQSGIRCVMDYAEDEKLKQALHSQLKEYDEVENRAQALARDRNWQVNELAPVVKSMSSMMSKMKLQYGDIDSKIADMMILGNTRGHIKGLRNLHKCEVQDGGLQTLAKDLLKYEEENIRQMQPFL